VDIGVWMGRPTLENKLALRSSRNPEGTWNLRNWPSGFSEGGDNRLFVASDGAWIGYFKISGEALYNPRDSSAPYTLLFDTRTWTRIEPLPTRSFRGFTYNVPRLAETRTSERTEKNGREKEKGGETTEEPDAKSENRQAK
jgi:hypothetical protein